jgi:orotidine-5'-phosphate decarboxylase
MNYNELFQQIKKKESFLCIGLDTDLNLIPKHLQNSDDPVFEFNKQIIDATSEFAVAYKPNIAFYESLGPKGWESLEKTIRYIPENIFTIADAKRGDIGNTSLMYAKTFFDRYNFDSVTVAPYMGKDSVTPFLDFKNKWVILLALTSNSGASDFQLQQLMKGERKLFEEVISTSKDWGTTENMMYVVGATQAEQLKQIRKIIPDHFLLIPGVGAQGGNLADVAKNGLNSHCGLLVNSSRQIMYASREEDFAEKARVEAKKLQAEMKMQLNEYADAFKLNS